MSSRRAESPEAWSAFTGIGLQKPFDLAFNASGDAFVTGNGNSEVAILGPDGRPLSGSPISGGGLARPLGIAADGGGNMWVANFGGQRVTELCGTSPALCPAGKRRTGQQISPAGSG